MALLPHSDRDSQYRSHGPSDRYVDITWSVGGDGESQGHDLSGCSGCNQPAQPGSQCVYYDQIFDLHDGDGQCDLAHAIS